jgi:hypothetical protein
LSMLASASSHTGSAWTTAALYCGLVGSMARR